MLPIRTFLMQQVVVAALQENEKKMPLVDTYRIKSDRITSITKKSNWLLLSC